MDLKFFFFAGTLLMLLVMTVANIKAQMPVWKILVTGVLLLPIGIFGTKVMRVVESQTLDGFSFYGAIFLVPVFMLAVARILHLDYGLLLDVCSPAGCIMLACMKVNCIKVGCCKGRILYVDQYENYIRFPSQLIELIVGLILLVVIMVIIFYGSQKRKVYAWFMLLYGITRFILNLFRETTPFVFGISAGCFWSIIAVSIGGGFLIMKSRSRNNITVK